MSKTIVLNGHTFTVHKSKYATEESLYRCSGRWLDDCYTRPSKAKQEIFKEWMEWAWLNDVMHFGVSSYNTTMFTLQGLVEHMGHKYILNITPNHNRAFILD